MRAVGHRVTPSAAAVDFPDRSGETGKPARAGPDGGAHLGHDSGGPRAGSASPRHFHQSPYHAQEPRCGGRAARPPAACRSPRPFPSARDGHFLALHAAPGRAVAGPGLHQPHRRRGVVPRPYASPAARSAWHPTTQGIAHVPAVVQPARGLMPTRVQPLCGGLICHGLPATLSGAFALIPLHLVLFPSPPRTRAYRDSRLPTSPAMASSVARR